MSDAQISRVDTVSVQAAPLGGATPVPKVWLLLTETSSEIFLQTLGFELVMAQTFALKNSPKLFKVECSEGRGFQQEHPVSTPLRWLHLAPEATPRNLSCQKCWEPGAVHLLGSSWVPYVGCGARERRQKAKAWSLPSESFKSHLS